MWRLLSNRARLPDGREVTVGRLRFSGASPLISCLAESTALQAAILALAKGVESEEERAALWLRVAAEAPFFTASFVYHSTWVRDPETGERDGVDITQLPWESALALIQATLHSNPIHKLAETCRRFFRPFKKKHLTALRRLIEALPTGGSDSASSSTPPTAGENAIS